MLRTFAILDCAVDPAHHAWIEAAGPVVAACLFRGELTPALRAASPYVVALDEFPAFETHWRDNGWGRSWGVWVRAEGEVPDIRRRLRHFTMARLPSGEGPMLFRFWDPRVLRAFLPTLDADDLPDWFKGIDDWLVELGGDTGLVARHRLMGGRLQTQVLPFDKAP